MSNERKIVFVMVGHTAAGKTTFARSFCKTNSIDYISEGEIKRSFVANYTAKNSLDEELRDKGYSASIKRAIEILEKKNCVLVDASFHKKKRRINLVTEILKKYKHVMFCWIYCRCPNYNKVAKRIENRALSAKNADNQADDIAIYSHILNSFDAMGLDQFSCDTIIITLDTDKNEVLKVESNFNFVFFKEIVFSVLAFTDHYLKHQRSKNG